LLWNFEFLLEWGFELSLDILVIDFEYLEQVPMGSNAMYCDRTIQPERQLQLFDKKVFLDFARVGLEGGGSEVKSDLSDSKEWV